MSTEVLSQVDNQPPETYATKDTIAEADVGTTCFVKLRKMSPAQIANGLFVGVYIYIWPLCSQGNIRQQTTTSPYGTEFHYNELPESCWLQKGVYPDM